MDRAFQIDAGRVVVTSPNQQVIDRYMEGFRRTDRAMILSCLTDDVEWRIPGMFHIRGKDDFNSHIVDEGFSGHPKITIIRVVEENDVVVEEGTVHAMRSDGTAVNVVFCDVFEMRDTKIAKLTSYLVVA